MTVTDSSGLSASDTLKVSVNGPKQHALVAAYSFDEGSGTTVSDASGHDNVGSITGATRITDGKYGSALLFDETMDEWNSARRTRCS